MSTETRDALLYGQLQEALRYEFMRAPVVSGSTKYQELFVAAKKLGEALSRTVQEATVLQVKPASRQVKATWRYAEVCSVRSFHTSSKACCHHVHR